MSVEQHKAIVRRMIEEPWNQGHLEVLDEICAPTYTIHGLGGLQELKQGITDARHAFPDLYCTIEEMIAEGDKIAFRWTMRGTQQGEWQGTAPTGKAMIITGITILRFADGKIVDDRFEGTGPEPEE